jgi:hypothetical protein
MSDCAYQLNDSGQQGEGIWVGIGVGDYVRTGVHLDIDGCHTVVMDLANTRKLIAMLVTNVMMLDNALELAKGAR